MQLTIQAVGGGALDLGDTAVLTSAVSLGQIEVLNPSTTDTAPYPTLTVGVKDSATGVYVESGTTVADARPFEAKIAGDPASGWTPIGGGSRLPFPAIAPLGTVTIDLRVVPRAGLETLPTDYRLMAGAGSRPAWLDTVPPAVLTGWRRLAAELVYRPAAAVKGAGDGDVDVPDAGCWILGEPEVGQQQTITLDDTDGDSVALGVGESYIALLVIERGLGWQTVKGSGGATPAAPATSPNQLALYQVTKTEATALTPGDIVALKALDGYDYLGASGLDVSLSAGRARAGRVETQHAASTHTMPDDSTSRVWVEPAGGLTVAADQPFVGALPLWEITAAAGAVTATRDLRSYSPDRRRLDIYQDAPATTVYGAAHGVLWPGPICVDYPEWPGDATSGDVTVTVEQLVAGTWETVVALVVAWDSGGTASQTPDPAHLRYYEDAMIRVTAVDSLVGGSAPGPAVVQLSVVGGS